MSTERDGQLASPSSICLIFIFVLLTHPNLLAGRKLYWIQSPFLEVRDVLGNGEIVPHHRSVVIFARFTSNEARETKTKAMALGGSGFSCWHAKTKATLDGSLTV